MATKCSDVKGATEYRRGELVRDVLRLVGAGVALGSVVVAPNMSQLIDYFNPKGRRERNRLWNAIAHMERSGLVSIEEHGGTEYVHLTKNGKARFDEERIWELSLTIPRRWDHKWRIVMFDLPSRCKERHAFRAKLEHFGFRPYQRSVFIYPHECAEEVRIVARWYGVEPHIRYLVATEIHDMRRFAEEFGLLSDS